MPAFTIAAECRYADTGVGAAIAPGSQKCQGAWADLVSAPSMISTIAAEMAWVFSMSVIWETSESFQIPALWPSRLMPTSMPRPPKVVTMSACMAARREEARSP